MLGCPSLRCRGAGGDVSSFGVQDTCIRSSLKLHYASYSVHRYLVTRCKSRRDSLDGPEPEFSKEEWLYCAVPEKPIYQLDQLSNGSSRVFVSQLLFKPDTHSLPRQ